MKAKRNLLLWMMVLALTFALSACGSRSDSEDTSSTDTNVRESVVTEGAPETESPKNEDMDAVTEEADTEDPAQESAGSKILVAYFSHTGNTEEVAQRIAEDTGADLAEIQRAEEYGDLYEEAEAEILEGVHPEITVSVEDISGYDTIFVGYPIWWDEAPAMIATFLADNDFAGKTIIPFCTSSSDEIDNSLHIFSELCPDAVIAEGLTANNLEDIEPWLDRLGVMEADNGNSSYESVEGMQIKMTADTAEVIITLNDSKAATDLVSMLPLELTLIERNEFAKGMTLPRSLDTQEETTRSYEIGDFGYWAAGPDLAIFYDDIYEQTIVPVIPMGKAETGAEAMRSTSGTVTLELVENNE